MKKILILLAFLGLISSVSFAQVDLKEKLSGYTNPEEIVTLSQNIPFNQAIEILSKVSEKLTGRKIVSTANVTNPIGIEIDKMPYMKALVIIVQYHNLVYEETESSIVVKSKDTGKETLAKDVYASVDEREVKISSVMFEANVVQMRERGINWQLLFSHKGLSVGGDLYTAQEQQSQSSSTTTQTNQQKSPDFGLSTSSEFSIGDVAGSATSMFRFFEDENLGEIVARPTVTVRSGIEGRTQVGSDISIKERDFAGNIIDRFYATGTIIEVTPYIYNEDGIDYILMKIKVERSTAIPGTITTEIRKTQASTSVLLLDGEETTIGGLFVNEETSERRGIPFLKDLPWWVFGIRYLTGWDYKSESKREIIITLKAEILPSLKERIAQKKEGNLIRQEQDANQKLLEKLKSQRLNKEEEK